MRSVSESCANRITDLEKESLDVFLLIRDRGTCPRLFKWMYMDLMHRIRMIAMKLENKSFGCASGLHAGPCTCKPDKPGVHIQ